MRAPCRVDWLEPARKPATGTPSNFPFTKEEYRGSARLPAKVPSASIEPGPLKKSTR
jgi:hypothetical protein